MRNFLEYVIFCAITIMCDVAFLNQRTPNTEQCQIYSPAPPKFPSCLVTLRKLQIRHKEYRCKSENTPTSLCRIVSVNSKFTLHLHPPKPPSVALNWYIVRCYDIYDSGNM